MCIFRATSATLKSLDLSYNALTRLPLSALACLNNLNWLNMHGYYRIKKHSWSQNNVFIGLAFCAKTGQNPILTYISPLVLCRVFSETRYPSWRQFSTPTWPPLWTPSLSVSTTSSRSRRGSSALSTSCSGSTWTTITSGAYPQDPFHHPFSPWAFKTTTSRNSPWRLSTAYQPSLGATWGETTSRVYLQIHSGEPYGKLFRIKSNLLPEWFAKVIGPTVCFDSLEMHFAARYTLRTG